MDIEKILKEELRKTSLTILTKKLGYQSKQRAKQVIEKFLSQSLYNWVYSGFYDFKFTSSEFLKKLCDIFQIDESKLAKLLQEYENRHQAIKDFEHGYIFVNTNFKRTTQPIHVLAVSESQRRLKLPVEQLIFKPKEEVTKIISNIVSKHYKKNKGKLGIWGNIVNYKFVHHDKEYFFSITGDKIKNLDIVENQATLCVK